MPYIFFRIFIFLFFTFSFSYAEQFSDSFRLDAYGNVRVIQLEENVDKLDLSAGFQGRYQFNDNISITGQMHFEEGENSLNRASNSLEDYDSELKWLYIDYYLKNDITLRAGAFQFPVFKSSETGDIGYTYTWTETPLKFYGVFGCDDFEGIELLKNFSYGDFDFLAQVSYGKSENELHDGRGNSREGKVDNLVGLTLKTSHDDFILNLGYLQATSTMNTRNNFMALDSEVDFNMFALESEFYKDDYTLKSGFIKTNLTNIFPEDIKYYISLEKNLGDYTPYMFYSNETLNFKYNSTNLPNVKQASTSKQLNDTYSLGLRYDYSSNIALKISYNHEVRTTKFDGFDTEKNSRDAFIGTINVIF